MTNATSVVVHADENLLCEAVAARVVTNLVDAQASRGSAHLVLTGGTVGIQVLASLAASPARDAIDWKAVDIWWGDERFLPSGDPERNETQARDALLDHVPVPRERVRPMPPSDGIDGDDVDAAAARYASELAAATRPEDHGEVPRFDVLLLGMGPDAHIASLFPGHPGVYEMDRTVIGVRGSPKPPPTRISLTLPALRAASEVWFVVSGESKAHAVHLALSQAGEVQVPAAGPRGTRATRWLLDRAAASQLPPGMERLASP